MATACTKGKRGTTGNPITWSSAYVVQRIFTRNIRQVEPVGDEVHSQDALQSNRWATVPCLRILRFNYFAEFFPGNQRFHTCKKLSFAGRYPVGLESIRRQCLLFHILLLAIALLLLTHYDSFRGLNRCFPKNRMTQLGWTAVTGLSLRCTHPIGQVPTSM
jgi:hypothetical protein